jgi:hypothetical protein
LERSVFRARGAPLREMARRRPCEAHANPAGLHGCAAERRHATVKNSKALTDNDVEARGRQRGA